MRLIIRENHNDICFNENAIALHRESYFCEKKGRFIK